MNELEREAVKLTAMLSATRSWAPIYSKTPAQHAALINAQAELQIVLTKFFRGMQKKARDFANWTQYEYQLHANHPSTLARQTLAYNVEVIVNNQQIDSNDGSFIKISFGTVSKMVSAGWEASEILHNIPTRIPSTSALIQQLTTKQVAKLVGKQVLPDGTIVDNPNAAYNIMDTVRNDVASSIKTSLGLGETTEEAVVRMQGIISPIQRAQRIVNTESVNAYQAGVTEFGTQSGAVGKEWETDSDPCPVCETNADEGPIPFDQDFDSGDSEPTAHPNCLCGKRTIYQDEWDAIQGGDSYEPQTGITPA